MNPRHILKVCSKVVFSVIRSSKKYCIVLSIKYIETHIKACFPREFSIFMWSTTNILIPSLLTVILESNHCCNRIDYKHVTRSMYDGVLLLS